jgi:hypothetical protein
MPGNRLPEYRRRQMLRPEIFDRFRRRALEVGGTYNEFALGPDEDVKSGPVALHIEDIRSDDRQLADDPYVQWLLGQDERCDLVVLLDHAGISRTSRERHCYGRVDGRHCFGLMIEARDQDRLGGRHHWQWRTSRFRRSCLVHRTAKYESRSDRDSYKANKPGGARLASRSTHKLNNLAVGFWRVNATRRASMADT